MIPNPQLRHHGQRLSQHILIIMQGIDLEARIPRPHNMNEYRSDLHLKCSRPDSATSPSGISVTYVSDLSDLSGEKEPLRVVSGFAPLVYGLVVPVAPDGDEIPEAPSRFVTYLDIPWPAVRVVDGVGFKEAHVHDLDVWTGTALIHFADGYLRCVQTGELRYALTGD